MNWLLEEWRRAVKGLFVGRFQPFHLGHLKVIEWILERCEKVTVVIGSSLEFSTQRNPFTYEERREMIEKSLEKEGIAEEKYEAAKREVIRRLKFAYFDLFWVDKALHITEKDL